MGSFDKKPGDLLRKDELSHYKGRNKFIKAMASSKETTSISGSV